MKKFASILLKNPRTIFKHVWMSMSKITPPRLYLLTLYWLYVNKPLRLRNPRSFTEKLQWLKLNYNIKDVCTKMADKYEVRDHVENTIGSNYLIPLLGVYDNFDDIDFKSLPTSFVLKTTHDSGGIVICKDKYKLDIAKAKKKLKSHLKVNYYWRGREYPYKNIKPRIIAEQFMVDESGCDLKDYKFFCFNGEPKVLFIASERFKQEGVPAKFTFYDMNLNILPFTSKGHGVNKSTVAIPKFSEMRDLAAKLSKGWPFLRVDFYNINGQIYFGEITFHHDGGLVPFEPYEWDLKLGEMINLPR